MSHRKKTAKSLHPDEDALAERYLNLWQDNIRNWATDPDSLEKWLKEITPAEKNAEKNNAGE